MAKLKLKDILKIAAIVAPAAPLIVAGGKAVVRSQKKGGSLVEELGTIMAGVAAAKAAHAAIKARPR